MLEEKKPEGVLVGRNVRRAVGRRCVMMRGRTILKMDVEVSQEKPLEKLGRNGRDCNRGETGPDPKSGDA